MLRKLGAIFSLLAVVVMIDGNWAVLQTVAWARMIEAEVSSDVDRSELPRRLAETFSGQRVCSMCVAIIEQRAAEDGEEPGHESRSGVVVLAPIAVSGVALTPPVPRRTAHSILHEELSAGFPFRIDPPPRVTESLFS